MSKYLPARRWRRSVLAASALTALTVSGGVLASGGNAFADTATSPYSLTIFAGTGTAGPASPGPADQSTLTAPRGIATDAAGNVYLADPPAHEIDKITPDGKLSIFAGTGVSGITTAGAADEVTLSSPTDVAVDGQGNVYIVDSGDETLDKVDTSGQLTIVAGDPGVSGATAPGAATATYFDTPQGVAVDSHGNVYVSDTGQSAIFKITSDGQLSYITGGGGPACAQTGSAADLSLAYPWGMAVDSHENLYVAQWRCADILKITPSGALTVVAGTSGRTGRPTNGPATSSTMHFPTGVAVDSHDNLYIADSSNDNVEKVTSDGQLMVIAGNNGGLPTQAGPSLDTSIGAPYGVTVAPDGTVYVADGDASLIDKLVPVPAVPSVPSSLVVKAGNASATLTFAVPTDTGSAAIEGYEYSTDGGTTWHSLTATVNGSTVTGVVGGLTNGTTYSFTVRALNSVGHSVASTAASATPAASNSWYADPLSKTQRAKLMAVPKHPTDYRGKQRTTTAVWKSHNGTLAVPASWAKGHQLTKGEAVTLEGSAFAFNSATLTRHGKQEVVALAASLKDAKGLTCEGYADYAGHAAHELSLSAARARAVCRELSALGPHLTKKAVGYGRARPVVVGGSAASRAANRRVVLLVTR